MSRGEWPRTTELIARAKEIIAREWPMTVRQALYRLVSALLLANTDSGYARCKYLLTKARNDGRIPFEWIVDRSRPDYMPSVWDDADEYMRATRNGYRKDYWLLQPQRVEVWCEKDAVVGSIQGLTGELGVRLRPCHGYLSTTLVHEIAEEIRSSDKPFTAFAVGDHDPSGCDIDRDLIERIERYGAKFTLKRLAIFKADIAKYKLPPLRVKPEDSRAEGFLRAHPNLLSPFTFINSVLPTKHLFGHDRP